MARQQSSIRRTDSLEPHWRMHGDGVTAYLFSFALFTLISTIVMMMSNSFDGGYLVILTVAASLAATDGMLAALGKRDVLSPRAILSVLMVAAVYAAPIVHISSQNFPRFVQLPLDISASFYELALVHLAGVLVYFIGVRVIPANSTSHYARRPSKQDGSDFDHRLIQFSTIIGIGSAQVFILNVMMAGGPMSWLSAQLNYRDELGGSGWIIALGSVFPTMFFISYLVSLKSKNVPLTKLKKLVVLAFVILVAVTFVVNGLRGSRANLVWPVLTALVVIHLMFFSISRKMIAVIGIGVTLFAGAYDIYKKAGVEGVANLQHYSLSEVEENSGVDFGFESLLLGDFSRTGIQAVLLDRWTNPGFDPYYGTTYVGDVLLFVPGIDSSEIIPDKVIAGTEVLYGEGSFLAGSMLSTRIFGLQGEALLNLGPVGAVLVFVPFAFVVMHAERTFARARAQASIKAVIVAALVTPAVALMYVSDFDNVVNYLSTKALLPLLALWCAGLASQKRRNRAPSFRKLQK